MIRSWRQAMRYFMFPDARVLDERTAQIDQDRAKLREYKTETGKIIKNANQPDVLRNLVIAMTRDRHGQV